MTSNFQNLVHTRRSIRKFEQRSVEQEKIKLCIEAARVAPSAEHVQPWRFIVIDEPDKKEILTSRAFSGIYSPTKWANHAPVIIVILAKLDILANRIGKQIQGTNYYLIDIGIAGEHFVLQAHELGLGSCWIGWFSAKGVRKALTIPRNYKIVSLLALGYPASYPRKEKICKSFEQICFFNTTENL
jgi:nitroreductase